ncbi:MAG: hypothetical protein LHW41_09580, partial [Candidatus Cloacimonetes bacterium]|nr:hypothetical protein [Candidatus Cloacimonadota bacterium]
LARGSGKDRIEAFSLCNELASKGDVKVLIPLAHMYRDGTGTQKDTDLSIFWLRKAIEKEVAGAKGELVNSLIIRNLDGDVAEALTLCENIAESGDLEGYNLMSKIYARGIGVEKDIDKAIYYARMASGMVKD